MKKILILLIFLLFAVSMIFAAKEYTEKNTTNKTIITGEVLAIGPIPPKDDNDAWLFRLVKYKVKTVWKGTYKKDEIIVSHFPNELDDLKVGDIVCLVLTKTVGPNVSDDFVVDLKGKDIHYSNYGDITKNSDCHK
jgi:hypothetical protein